MRIEKESPGGRGAGRQAEGLDRPSTVRVPGAQPPVEQKPADLAPLPKAAGGLPAVYQTLRFSLREMGAMRTLRTLLSMNKKRGFDCQSCAWPSPDKHRKVAEFCENGAKAVADEATTKRLTADFFRRHSLDDLRRQSDLWLGQQGRLTQPLVKTAGTQHYEPLSWDDVFRLIAAELNTLPSP